MILTDILTHNHRQHLIYCVVATPQQANAVILVFGSNLTSHPFCF